MEASSSVGEPAGPTAEAEAFSPPPPDSPPPSEPRKGRARAILIGALVGLAIGGGAAAAAVLLLGGDDPKPAATAAEESNSSGDGESVEREPAGTVPADTEECERVPAPEPKDASFSEPAEVVEPGETATAVVETSCGTFRIALDAQRAPRTVNSFVFLAEQGLYDGLSFHRIAPDFVIQGGDPLGDGTGGPGYSVTERPPDDLAYTRGVVAMAKAFSEPAGRSGSQFFVVLAPDAGLPPEYALLGKVSEGEDAVERIAALGTPSEQPKQPVSIERISIERG